MNVQATTVDEIIDNLTLFDDDLMSLVFDHNVEATNLLLRIILQRNDVEVLEVTGQRELENPIVNGRNIKLDILARDNCGRLYDIEVQRDNGGAHFRRARFHSSMVDTRMLKERQNFKDMRDSYIIFITEKDYLGKRLPLYHLSRIIEETGELAEDGSHIIYVNGSYKGNDDIGLLMHDFSCKNYEDIHYPALKNSVKHFKKEGGQSIMCKAVEDYGKEQAIIAETKNVKSLMEKLKITMEQAFQMLDIPEDEQKPISTRLQK